MVEQEAKKKWCPFARSQTEDREAAPAVNRTLQGGIDIGCHCIGSACMAWRWGTPERRHFVVATDPRAKSEPVRPGNVTADYSWSPDEDDGEPAGWLAPMPGFCGLAGKP